MSFLEPRLAHRTAAERAFPVAFQAAIPRGRAIACLRGHEQRVPAHPPGAGAAARSQVSHSTFCLGGLSFFFFLVLTVTGVFLMFFYVPSSTSAYDDILRIQAEVPFGLLTRNIHRWGAHLMVFFVFLHMMRVFYHGAYKPPREFNWVIGTLLLFFTIALSFTGYLLPWDQIAFWAITIGNNIASYVPLLVAAVAAADLRRDRGQPEHPLTLLRASRDRSYR